MKSDHFEITADARRSLLKIRMCGHWTSDVVDDYQKAVVSAVTGMLSAGSRRGGLLALVDARELSAQSQDVVADFKATMDRGGLVPRRLATLLSSALLKRQVERIAVPNQRLFSDEDEALAWLLSADGEP